MKTFIKINRVIVMLAAAGFFSGCGVYNPIEVVPDHIRTLNIKTFRNETQQIELTSALTEKVTDEFVREGRLTVVNTKESDSSLEGTIINYSKAPLGYDENFVAQQYMITLIVNIRFYDHINGVRLWEDIREDHTGGIETSVTYDVRPDAPFIETEEEARQRLLEDTAKKILHRTIYGWE
ncbi:MAG: LptE family protein [Elusimicrobiota bacterium]